MTGAQQVAEEIADVARRLRALERTASLANSAVRGSAIHVYDVYGNLRQIVGRQDDDRYTITDHGGPPPPTPGKPTTEMALGGALVRWDGVYADVIRPADGTWGPAPRNADTKYVEIHAAPVPVYIPSTTTRVGVFSSPNGGQAMVPLAAGEWYLTLVAFSSSHVESAPSESTRVDALPALYTRFHQDTVTAAAGLAHTIPLTYEPIGGSEHVYWNRVYQPQETWTREGGSLFLLDQEQRVADGDLLTVEYAHMGVDAPPGGVLVTDGPLDFRGAVTDLNNDAVTRVIALPPGTRDTSPPDTIVVAVAGDDHEPISISDPRLTRVADLGATGGVWVGRATTLDPVTVTTVGSPWTRTVIATYGAFLDDGRVVQRYQDYRVGAAKIVPAVPGYGSGAIVCMVSRHSTGGSGLANPSAPGYQVAQRAGLYNEVTIMHTEAGVVTEKELTYNGGNPVYASIVGLGVLGGVL